MDQKTVIRFSHVNKIYYLYKSSKQRLIGTLFKRHKNCKKKLAVNDLSFEIKQGEAVAFLGRNGAGKSTLLRLIAGVLRADRGQVCVDGQNQRGRCENKLACQRGGRGHSKAFFRLHGRKAYFSMPCQFRGGGVPLSLCDCGTCRAFRNR